MRALEQRLRAGGMVSIRAGDVGQRALELPFLAGTHPPRDRRARASPLATGAALLPVCCVRRGPGDSGVAIEPPLASRRRRAAGATRPTTSYARSRAQLEALGARASPQLWSGWYQMPIGARARGGRAVLPGDAAGRAALLRSQCAACSRSGSGSRPAGRSTNRPGLLGQGIGLDSVEVLQLVSAIEERYELTIDDDDLHREHFATLGTVVDFIAERLPA